MGFRFCRVLTLGLRVSEFFLVLEVVEFRVQGASPKPAYTRVVVAACQTTGLNPIRTLNPKP